MHKTKKERKVEVRENIRGGVGAVTLHHLIEKEESCDKLLLSAVLHIEPGQSVGLHPHGPDAELYYLLKGKLIVTDDGEEYQMKKGGVMFTCNGGTHSVRNDSHKTAKLLAIVLP